MEMLNTNNDDRQIWQSQNFLKDPKFVKSLVEKSDINNNDLVVEIGPGKGIITEQLSTVAGHVVAIEADSKLSNRLQTQFNTAGNVTIINSDFMKWNLPRDPYKVFSNIPFNMTSDIIKKLTTDRYSPDKIYLIIQDKAAFRYMGKPRDNQVSILMKPWYETKILSNIDRREYVPTPKVDTVLIEISRRKNPIIDISMKQKYRDFVIYGFNQWKPTILDSYSNIFTSKQRTIIEKQLGIRGLKPSDLSINMWVELFKIFDQFVPSDKKSFVSGSENRLKEKQKGMKKWHRTR